MEASLARSLRSLVAGAALLMAAVTIAASPNVGELMPAPWQKRAQLTAPVHQLSRDLGVASLRYDEEAAAAAAAPVSGRSLGLLVLAALSLACMIAVRRMPPR